MQSILDKAEPSMLDILSPKFGPAFGSILTIASGNRSKVLMQAAKNLVLKIDNVNADRLRATSSKY